MIGQLVYYIFIIALALLILLLLFRREIKGILRGPDDWRRIFRIALLVALISFLILIVAYYLGVFLPPFVVLPFEISSPRMVLCSSDAESHPCTAPQRDEFLMGEDVCIAWTEVNRRPSQSLAIYVYNMYSDEQVFVYEEPEPQAAKEAQNCRILSVRRPMAPGLHYTEFVAAGQPAKQQVAWRIIAPTPTPTSTPTPTPTPTPPPTPTPFVPPLFEIKEPRMVDCDDAERSLCEAWQVFRFNTSNLGSEAEICIAWTEVDRQPSQSLAVYIYDSQDNQVFVYKESEPQRPIVTQNCRVLPVWQLTKPGTYRTEFVVVGQVVDRSIHWSIVAPIDHVDWSSDGTHILTVDRSGCVNVWNTVTGRSLVTLGEHSGEIRRAAWSPDDARIAAAGRYGNATVWDAVMGRTLVVLRGHRGEVHHTAWSSDGARIVTASRDGSAIVWDANTGEALVTLSGHGGSVYHAAWSSDDTRIVTIYSWDNWATVWDADTGEPLVVFAGHSDRVYHAAWNSDDTRIVTASSDGRAIVWDAASGEVLVTLSGNRESIHDAEWSPDDTRILTFGWWNDAVVWNATTGESLLELGGDDGKWSSDGARIVTIDRWSHSATVWDTTTGESLVALSGHSDDINDVAWSLDDTRIVTASDDGTAIVWDAATGKALVMLSMYDAVD